MTRGEGALCLNHQPMYDSLLRRDAEIARQFVLEYFLIFQTFFLLYVAHIQVKKALCTKKNIGFVFKHKFTIIIDIY